MEPREPRVAAAFGNTRPDGALAGVEEARTRILAEHAKLRPVIHEVDRLALAVASEELRDASQLRRQAAELYRVLGDHIDHEEVVLGPLIRHIDAWGEVRFEQLQRDHVAQRSALAQAVNDLQLEGQRLGEMVQSMCWEILHDMRREEHDLLHPDLWRADGVNVGIGS